MAYEENAEFASLHSEGTYQAPVGDHGHLRGRKEPPATRQDTGRGGSEGGEVAAGRDWRP